MRVSVKSTMLDIGWVSAFVCVWSLLITLWYTWWALVLIPLFACMLAGLSEVMHQCMHGGMFGRHRGWNTAVGRFAGAVVGVDLETYRRFHLSHHRAINTDDDPEYEFYDDPKYVALTRDWESLSFLGKSIRILRLVLFFADAMASLGISSVFVRSIRFAIPLCIGIYAYTTDVPYFLIPAPIVVAWILPHTLFLFIDYLLALSEHYGNRRHRLSAGTSKRNTVPASVQYGISWNVLVPIGMSILLLRRNMHAEHHGFPRTHWTHAQPNGRSVSVWRYLAHVWRYGPSPEQLAL